MTDLEKLARDICWAGFHYPPKGGKVKYWAKITPGARASYIETAKEFAWIANRLGKERIASVFSRVPPTQTEEANEQDTTPHNNFAPEQGLGLSGPAASRSRGGGK